MKILLFSVMATVSLFSAQTFAHDIHNVASDHTHTPNNRYTHSVSSAYNHHDAHQGYNTNRNNRYNSGYNTRYNSYHYRSPRLTTNTATYYTRNYPITKTYSYLTTPNTTIHQPPFAYSSCANDCNQAQRRITVSRTLGTSTQTYRAPSEYSAQDHYVTTPNRNNNYYPSPNTRTTHYVSPFKTHKLTTTTCYNCY